MISSCFVLISSFSDNCEKKSNHISASFFEIFMIYPPLVHPPAVCRISLEMPYQSGISLAASAYCTSLLLTNIFRTPACADFFHKTVLHHISKDGFNCCRADIGQNITYLLLGNWEHIPLSKKE
jgi:hypothetical protein